jgi:hypothetical protein
MSTPRLYGKSAEYGKVMQSDGIIYLLTLCCDASGKGSTPGVVCRQCYKPVDSAYGDAAALNDAEAVAAFVARYHVKETEKAVTDNESKTDETKVDIAVPDAQSVQETMINLRKELGMSRRQLSEAMGWTESRVWYLEQTTIDYKNERNLTDMGTMTAKLQELKEAGWAKPTVRSQSAGLGTRDKEIVATAVAEAVAAVRATLGEELEILTTLVQSKLDEAKAKKTNTKGYAEILEAIKTLKWSAE